MYDVGTHQKQLTELLLMITHNIHACFCGEIRNKFTQYLSIFKAMQTLKLNLLTEYELSQELMKSFSQRHASSISQYVKQKITTGTTHYYSFDSKTTNDSGTYMIKLRCPKSLTIKC